MNQKEFVQKSEYLIQNMNVDELRICLHNIARKTDEDKRLEFLLWLEDSHIKNKENDKFTSHNLKKILPDEKVKNKLMEIKNNFAKIEEGELCISAEGCEDYSDGYYSNDWIWEYSDSDGVGDIIQDAVLFAHDCMNDCRYEEAVEIFQLAMDTQISVNDENGGDSFEFGLEEMVDEKLVGINLKVLALDVLYSNYQLQSKDRRASVLYSYFTCSYFEGIRIEEIFSVGREELKEIDMFFESWIDFLIKQKGDISARLLKEGILYFKGTGGLLTIARTGYKEHPSAYLAVLLEYEKTHEYEKIKAIGKEALDRLDVDLKLRGEIALKMAKATCFENEKEFVGNCFYEAFYSNSTVPNYLRLFSNNEIVTQYKALAEKRVENLVVSETYDFSNSSEMDKNSITKNELNYLWFFTGHFDRIQEVCMEQKKPLGWSGNFIGTGLNLMMLYLYSNSSLSKALKKIVSGVSNNIRFNEKENLLSEINANTQKKDETFWNIFCLWKSNYDISDDSKNSHINWIEDIITKRVDAIVGGKFRSRYDEVALLIAGLGEVKESMGIKMAKSDTISKYANKYLRHSSFRGSLREYMN